MRFLVDMGISPKTATYLRQQGHDVLHAVDEGLHRAADRLLLSRAREESRIILTQDLDFSQLIATTESRLPSVIIFRLTNMRPDNVNAHLDRIIAEHADVLEHGAVLSVGERTVRVRKLPIGR